MDRFAWLGAQKRWIRPWQGCHNCSSCEEARFLFCHRLKWIFQGYASFHLNDTSTPTSHLFFLTTHSSVSSDPAQLASRLGLVMEDEVMEMQDLTISNISGREKLILLFDDTHPFALQMAQVDSISFCSQDTPCSSTDEASRKEGGKCSHACGCHQVPSHISLNLRHVALNVYADEQFKETFWNTTSLSQVKEILDKNFLEKRQIHLIDNSGSKDEENCMKQAELPFEASDVINNQGHVLLNKYLNDIDCMCECAMKVVEVCSADSPWMGRMLNVMAQHAGNQSLEPGQLETLKASLLQRLEELREREKLELEKTWVANSHHIIQQQKMEVFASSSFEYLKQERECIEEALLEAELLSTILAI